MFRLSSLLACVGAGEPGVRSASSSVRRPVTRVVQFSISSVQLFHPSAGSVRALRHPAPRRSAGLYIHKYQVLARPAGAIVLNYLLSFRFATAGRESL